jgi:hypothetical protein
VAEVAASAAIVRRRRRGRAGVVSGMGIPFLRARRVSVSGRDCRPWTGAGCGTRWWAYGPMGGAVRRDRTRNDVICMNLDMSMYYSSISGNRHDE